ncbi:hypothetical protein FMUBM48_47430 [Nocardia cyriacigeorgica]|nr:hypothetical protein FMUBM48_47430 [Nocardia cyriacigeorgica]
MKTPCDLWFLLIVAGGYDKFGRAESAPVAQVRRLLLGCWVVDADCAEQRCRRVQGRPGGAAQ